MTNNFEKPLFLFFVIWLFGWYFKIWFFAPYFFITTFQTPVALDFFPVFFQNPLVSAIAFSIPILLFFYKCLFKRPSYIAISSTMIICSLILSFHLNSYNDATFVVSFWTALWMLWLSIQEKSSDPFSPQMSQNIAKAIFGLIFFGGAVGKITPEFFSGETMFQIFFTTRDYFFFPWMKSHFDLPSQLIFAQVFAWILFASEIILALALLFSTRSLLIIASTAFIGIILFCNFQILSVLSCLWGLIFVNDRYFSKALIDDEARQEAQQSTAKDSEIQAQ